MGHWFRMTIRQRDEEASRIAEANGTTLRPVTLSPSVAKFIEMGETEFGVEVLARPHFFMSAHDAFTSDDEPVVALHVSPSDTEADQIRRLAHEFGHRQQKKVGDIFDRDTLEGYVACERSAESYGWALAARWGFGSHFLQDYQTEVDDSFNDFESALYDLQASLEIHNAFALVAIGLQIIYLESPQVERLLRPFIEDRKMLNGWGELDHILWGNPEIVSGFDRFCLGSSWIVSGYGETLDLVIDDELAAAKALYELMQDSTYYSLRKPALARAISRQDDDKTGRYVVCFEGLQAGAARFIGLLHDLLIKFSEFPVTIDFWWASFDDMSILKATAKWKLDLDGHEVEWSIFLYPVGRELVSTRGQNIISGLQYFVKSFSRRCGVYSKKGSDLWRDLVWLLGQNSVEIEVSKYISSKISSKI